MQSKENNMKLTPEQVVQKNMITHLSSRICDIKTSKGIIFKMDDAFEANEESEYDDYHGNNEAIEFNWLKRDQARNI